MSARPISTGLSHLLVKGLLPRIDSRLEASRRPFDTPDILRPHADGGRWTATHYGVFIPDLPAPHRYLNTMTLIGATGAELFDNDYLSSNDARRTATVLSSTAADNQHHYQAYDTVRDCEFTTDGTVLRWGKNLEILADYPYFTVRGRYQDFSADLFLTATDQVSYFVKTPVYDHLSLLATYRGVIEDSNGSTTVEGLGTVEYARFTTHQSVTRRPLPRLLKLPVDFFTYQIINIDAETQILLTDVRARGAVACRLAHLRVLGSTTEVFTDAHMEVLEYQEFPLVDDLGRAMRAPLRLRWVVRDPAGVPVLELEGIVDAPMRYGHGRGYVGAYTYTGQYRGRPVMGTAYLEWIDVTD